LIDFYRTRKSHYVESDYFIKNYRQRRGGYIREARKQGQSVEQDAGEPNQKWHLLNCYFGDITEEQMEKEAVCYNRFRCPELMLWMAESAGCDVKAAAETATQWCEQGNNGTNRREAYKAIRRLIPWEILKKAILSNPTGSDC